MASVVILQGDDRPAREPAAICDRCGRRGTYARITRHTNPLAVRRFCLRCWPRAHREAIGRRNAEIAAWRRIPHDTEPADWAATIRSRMPPAETVTWHWLATLGTHWRYFRYER